MQANLVELLTTQEVWKLFFSIEHTGRENARTGTKAKFNNCYDHNRELEKETNVKVFDLKKNYGT